MADLESSRQGSPGFAALGSPAFWGSRPRIAATIALVFTAGIVAALVFSSVGPLAKKLNGSDPLQRTISQLETQQQRTEQLAEKMRGVIETQQSRTEPLLRSIVQEAREQRAAQSLAMMMSGSGAAPKPANAPDEPATADASANPAEASVGASMLGKLYTGPTVYRSGAEGSEAGLSRMQKAFRYAFETGWPVVVGGKVDPQSGQLLGGRTLDPGVARRLGIQRWEEWYMLDDTNERLLLQQQAHRYNQQKDPSNTGGLDFMRQLQAGSPKPPPAQNLNVD